MSLNISSHNKRSTHKNEKSQQCSPQFIVFSVHYNVDSFPEKGLPETGNHYPGELLICHFHMQLGSSSWISQTPRFPMCRGDKMLQML